MGVPVTLYTTTSDPRKINKVIDLVVSIECLIKDPTNKQTPKLILASVNVPGLPNVPNLVIDKFNYVYISSFDRYYFVTSKTVNTTNNIEISCKFDPLYTWKTNINNSKIIASRSGDTTKTNAFLPDEIPLQVNRNVIYKKFENTSPYFGSDKTTTTTPAYLLTVLTGGSGQSDSGAPVLSFKSVKYGATATIVLTLTGVHNGDEYVIQERPHFDNTTSDWYDFLAIEGATSKATKTGDNSYDITLTRPTDAGYQYVTWEYRVKVYFKDGTVVSSTDWSTVATVPANSPQ